MVGGGIAISSDSAIPLSSLNIINNLFYNNTSVNNRGADIDLEPGINAPPPDFHLLSNAFNHTVPQGFYSNFTIVLDPSNLDAIDPLFVNPAVGDLHLQSNSPMIDKGTLQSPFLPDTDLDGQYRFLGESIDIGTYEYADSALTHKRLTIEMKGAGSGKVTSDPTGIDCPIDCAQDYLTNTEVVLQAVLPVGDKLLFFRGWSGDTDCSDGTITLDNDKNCIATFASQVNHSAPDSYTAGTSLTVTNELNDEPGRTPLSLVWRFTLPSGWSIIPNSVTGDGSPELNPNNGREILFTGILPAPPIHFSYKLAVPASASGAVNITAEAEYQNDLMPNAVKYRALPDPLIVQDASSGGGGGGGGGGDFTNVDYHSADYQSSYWQINTTEASRVLAYWRAGSYHLDAAGEDGYAPGPAPPAASLLAASDTSSAVQNVSTSANHAAPAYQAGQNLTILNTLIPPGDAPLLSLLWLPNPPEGWTIVSVTGDGTPELGPNRKESVFTGALTANPLKFSYTIAVPAGSSGINNLTADYEYQTSSMVNPQSLSVQPNPLVLFSPGTVSASQSQVQASQTTVVANGSPNPVITVTVKDPNSNVLAGKTVSLTQGAGSSVISPTSATSNASGVATFSVSNVKPEVVTYSAVAGGVALTQKVQVNFIDPYRIIRRRGGLSILLGR